MKQTPRRKPLESIPLDPEYIPKTYVTTPEFQPYYDLWCEVLKQARRDKNLSFLRSKDCAKICNMIGLDYDTFINALPPVIKQRVLNER